MKILACFFRKNQALFFGKRGTSLLGFMVITNRPDCPGEFNVVFVFLCFDDTGHDDWQTACGLRLQGGHHCVVSRREGG